MGDRRKKLIKRADRAIDEFRRYDVGPESKAYVAAQQAIAGLARNDMVKLLHDMRAYLCSEKDFSKFSWDVVPKHKRYVRYYVMYGMVCKKDRGFRTREEVDEWIEKFGLHIVYQDAKTLTFMLNDLDSEQIKIVDKNGEVYQR